MLRTLLVLALAPAAAMAQSPQACPWLNAGTAAKILGSEVTSTVHSDSNWSGSCRYLTSTSPAASIEVDVGKTDSHPCGSGATPLTAIGNQAVLCSVLNKSGQNVETVSAQVRDAWFVLVLTTSPRTSPASSARSEPAASPPIEFLAEQVAGNLY